MCSVASSASARLWLCDCPAAAHASNILASGNFEARRLADVSADIAKATTPACQHVVAAPFFLASRRQSGLLPTQTSPLSAVELIQRVPPFTCSVALDKSSQFRVIVRETVQHNLECSRCSQRGYLCEHAKLAVLAADDQTRARLRVTIESKNGSETVGKMRKSASADGLVGDKPAQGGQSVRWPLKLRDEPATVLLPRVLCCTHGSQCFTNCDCKNRLSFTEVLMSAPYIAHRVSRQPNGYMVPTGCASSAFGRRPALAVRRPSTRWQMRWQTRSSLSTPLATTSACCCGTTSRWHIPGPHSTLHSRLRRGSTNCTLSGL